MGRPIRRASRSEACEGCVENIRQKVCVSSDTCLTICLTTNHTFYFILPLSYTFQYTQFHIFLTLNHVNGLRTRSDRSVLTGVVGSTPPNVIKLLPTADPTQLLRGKSLVLNFSCIQGLCLYFPCPTSLCPRCSYHSERFLRAGFSSAPRIQGVSSLPSNCRTVAVG